MTETDQLYRLSRQIDYWGRKIAELNRDEDEPVKDQEIPHGKEEEEQRAVGKGRQEPQLAAVLLPELGVGIEHHAYGNAEEEHANDDGLDGRHLDFTDHGPDVRPIVVDPHRRIPVKRPVGDGP